jgi:hypothetical protein
METAAPTKAIDDLTKALDALAELDPSALSDPETLLKLQRSTCRLEAITTSAVGEFDTWGGFADDGARSAAAWLTAECRMPASQAQKQVSRSRRLRQLKECAGAWRNGDIGAAQVDAICRKHKGATRCTLEEDETMLVNQARILRFSDLIRLLEYWGQHADPDGTEEDAEARRARRDFYLVRSLDGMYLGQMTLDPITGEVIFNELDRLERELFDQEWKDAKARLGFDPSVGDLARTPGQRRVDALREMAERSRAMPAGATRPAALLSVLVGYETLHGPICQTARGTVISPGSLLPWLDEAYIERAVFDPPNRVEVSATARLFTGATRRALELRDQMCTHPYCEQPVQDCEADHIQPYAAGGPTIQANGRMLCSYHNRLRNQRPPPPR